MDTAKILAGLLVFFLFSAVAAVFVLADETVPPEQQPGQQPVPPEASVPPVPEPAPAPSPEQGQQEQQQAPTQVSEPVPEPEPIVDFDLINVTPDDGQKGDVLLKIVIKNTGTVPLQNLVPVVVGRGFSTYDTIPVAELKPGKKGDIFVSGNFAEPGDILLTIKVNDHIFYDRIHISTVEPDAAAQERAAKIREELLNNLTAQIGILKAGYDEFEQELRKKKKGYDVSEVKLDDLKKYLLAAEAAGANGEIEKIRPLLVQAQGEYTDQRERLNAAQKKPFLSIIRDNIVLVSATIGSIITIFTGYEFFRKKQQVVVEKIKEIKETRASRAIKKEEKKKKGKKKEEKKEKGRTKKSDVLRDNKECDKPDNAGSQRDS